MSVTLLGALPAALLVRTCIAVFIFVLAVAFFDPRVISEPREHCVNLRALWVRFDQALHVREAPTQAARSCFLPHLRHCGVDFLSHPQLLPEVACLPHDELILRAVQGHRHACFHVTIRCPQVQLHVAHDINHDVHALLWSAPGHAHAFAHLAHELDGLRSRVQALHVLIEVCVWRLQQAPRPRRAR